MCQPDRALVFGISKALREAGEKLQVSSAIYTYEFRCTDLVRRQELVGHCVSPAAVLEMLKGSRVREGVSLITTARPRGQRDLPRHSPRPPYHHRRLPVRLS